MQWDSKYFRQCRFSSMLLFTLRQCVQKAGVKTRGTYPRPWFPMISLNDGRTKRETRETLRYGSRRNVDCGGSDLGIGLLLRTKAEPSPETGLVRDIYSACRERRRNPADLVSRSSSRTLGAWRGPGVLTWTLCSLRGQHPSIPSASCYDPVKVTRSLRISGPLRIRLGEPDVHITLVFVDFESPKAEIKQW